ncbi:hypothetical protein BVC80_1173g26 [Macleaya cordata]|uniref:Uncharacterized protein n=1 Tax=Macleaya cordata TaxID=56857 RepID=A0A200QIP6_MACCD|nr:hypothetical protein BVC80_1173g26 [Macleaya cordata]
MAQELRDCLPVWVSQDQVIDLLTRSSGNIVEAVSDFYERETEYHEQVIAFRTSSAISQKSLLTVPASLPNEAVSEKGTTHGSVGSILSQEKKKMPPTPNISRSSKNTVSPRKRGSGAGLQSKAKKKVKPSSTPQPTSGSKQATITKFFSKVSPNAS